MALIEGIILTVTVFYLLYKYGTKNFNYWKDKGVPHRKPIPIVGNSINVLTRKLPPTEDLKSLYDEFPNERFFGVYRLMEPLLVVRDLDLLKQIMIKDFDYFTNRISFVNQEADPLFGKNLAALKDQQWRDMRNTLSPVFTASKMKIMFQLIDNCAEQLTRHIDDLIKKQDKDKSPDGEVYETDFKKLFSRMTIDVIATTAFGVQVDSLKDPDNDFYKMAVKVTNFQGLAQFKIMVMLLLPKVAKLLKLKFWAKDIANFFRGLVHGTIKVREEQDIVRPDLIHIMMQARKGITTDESNQEGEERTKKELSDDDITAQALLFFLAGFESTSTVLGFCAYELALHPDIQERLRDEVESVIKEDGGKMTYEGLMYKMKYLDAVVNELLRKWPPGFIIDRQVSKTYVIPETNVTLNVDDTVLIPAYAIHRDPKYFPDPEKFDPERFSEENKANVVPFSFLGFGQGPRNCIGMRFALMETKASLAHLVRKFQFVPTANTRVPLRIDRKSQAQLRPEGGFIYGIKART